jgi:hypothetical protein
MEVMWKQGVDHMTMEFSSDVKHRGKIRRRMSSDQSSKKEAEGTIGWIEGAGRNE